jgi:hypothetical protein
MSDTLRLRGDTTLFVHGSYAHESARRRFGTDLVK